MIAIADSGSTKTDWIFAENKNTTFHFQSIGFHPLRIQEGMVRHELAYFTHHQDFFPKINELFFYGAGCGDLSRTQVLKKSLEQVFPAASIHIFSDMLGACIASSANQPSICSILGTGSNSAVFDGQKITSQQLSLGYLLGDEGSGSDIGRRLLQKVLYQDLPAELIKEFMTRFNKTAESIIRETYTSSLPNRYLAGYSAFAFEHIDNPMIEQLVVESLENFISRHLLAYPEAKELPIHFSGSVAFFFKEMIIKLMSKHHLIMGKIEQSPINGLIRHHLGE